MTSYRKTAGAAALTPEQFRVTQRSGTERPGTGQYLGNKEPGIGRLLERYSLATAFQPFANEITIPRPPDPGHPAHERNAAKRPWLVQLLARRKKIAAVALANKTARTIWALIINGERYREPLVA